MANESAAGAANAAASEAAAAASTESAAAATGAETGATTEGATEAVNKRDAWKQRYKQRYAPEAEDVDTDSDEYYDNLNKMADDYDRMEGNEKQMNDLLEHNPSFSDMIRDAKEGKSFFPSLVERFGSDNLRKALEGNTKIIATTIQKFLYIGDTIKKINNKMQTNASVPP